MELKDWLIWTTIGLGAVLVGSLFLSFLPVIFWFAALAWWGKETVWLVLVVGLVNDLFLFEPLGKTPLIGLVTILIIRAIKRVLSINWPKRPISP